jgi:hypothetical protein
MTASSLIVVADRGRLKAYRVTEPARGGLRLRLVKRINIRQARPQARRTVVDITGKDPVTNESGGPHLQLISAPPPREQEIERRICQELANQIVGIVKAERNQRWAFAAPPAIHRKIVDLLPSSTSDWIVEHVEADLAKTSTQELPAHFRSLQPV